MEPERVLDLIIRPAMTLLPPGMSSRRAETMLLAIGLQESRFEHRRQIKGPARGFWQFERAGGVAGVMTHPQTQRCAEVVTGTLHYEHNTEVVHAALEHNDILAACFARLLLYADPEPLPDLDDYADVPWRYYLHNWRPGKPHHGTWPDFWHQAVNLSTY